MITEDYVSFETAKLLKEKGFDGNCYKVWAKESKSEPKLYVAPSFVEGDTTVNKESVEDGERFINDLNPYEHKIEGYLAPTLQMAMKWLRDVHKLGVFPSTYYREINRNVKNDYGSTIVRLDTYEVIGNGKNIEDYTFEAETYEETADKAIRYCLENLI